MKTFSQPPLFMATTPRAINHTKAVNFYGLTSIVNFRDVFAIELFLYQYQNPRTPGVIAFKKLNF